MIVNNKIKKTSLIYESYKGYIQHFITFDIETSSFIINKEKKSTMYLYGIYDNGICTIGRTWKDFLKDINKLISIYNVSEQNKLVIYIHNLSYEFQFIRKLFIWSKVFILDNRKIGYALTNTGIEFRCSYILSNYSLKNLANNIIGYNGKKLDDFDYDLVRHSKTKLSKREIEYIYYDCEIVYKYIEQLINVDNYKINDIPLTSTSFVRNFIKEQKKIYKNKDANNIKIINGEFYLFIRKIFMGGYTHANYIHVNKILRNVDSYDITSSYPWTIISEKYPCETPKKYIVKSKEDFIEKITNYFCLFEVKFYNIKPKFKYDNYISLSKCRHIKKYRINNGRVIQAEELIIKLTEIDFEIINKCYTWEKLEIGDFYYGKKSFLPKYIIKSVIKFFNDKTKLCDTEFVNEYSKSKEMLNSIYGAMVTDIIRDEYVYENNRYKIVDNDLEELINSYNKKDKIFNYLWGIYIPAFARRNLWHMIFKCNDKYIYTDTDSIKCFKGCEKLFEEYNKKIDEKIKILSKIHDISINNLKVPNKYGKIKTMGYFKYECTYNVFKTLGAKRYIYYTDDIHIVTSGVNKEKGANYLKRTYKTLYNIFKNYDDNIEFPAEYIYEEKGKEKNDEGCGKKTLTYLDDIQSGEVLDYQNKVYKFFTPSGIHMEKASYNLSLEYNFLMLLKGGSTLI